MTSVRDILIVAVILFAVGITVVFAVDIGHRVNSNLLTVPVMANNSNAVSVINNSDAAINQTDYIYLALFIAFFLSIVIAGWLVGGVPIAAPIYFFVVVIFGFVAVILQSVWGDIAANSQVFNATLNMPITSFILSHLGYFTVIFGLVGILVMFAKPNERM